ncbi:MAG: cwlD [Bacillales bacterium]|jgi:N-acetylmuramoyl-L-alanine amidase|nr:cwlD [Bacillales bacterium]
MKFSYKLIFVILIGTIAIIFSFKEEIPFIKALSPKTLPMSGRIIVIDPGHGGPDGGANQGDILEKDIALKVAKNLRDYLQQHGAIVIMTREKDTDLAPKKLKGLSKRKRVDLAERVEIINESEADLYISIHLNSLPDGQWRGAQTFYNKKEEENKLLAESIQKQLIKTLGNTDRKARNLKDVYLVERSKTVGALVEIGFLSNDEERQLLQNKKYQEKVAFAIYGGITKFLTKPENEK